MILRPACARLGTGDATSANSQATGGQPTDVAVTGRQATGLQAKASYRAPGGLKRLVLCCRGVSNRGSVVPTRRVRLASVQAVG
jgi:hypothetical protein